MQNNQNGNGSGNCFDDKCMMQDLLTSEKHLTGTYNTNLNESATTTVQNCLSGILSETHSIQQEVFNEMSSRGWYQTEKAEDTKINQAKQKFSGSTQAKS